MIVIVVNNAITAFQLCHTVPAIGIIDPAVVGHVPLRQLFTRSIAQVIAAQAAAAVVQHLFVNAVVVVIVIVVKVVESSLRGIALPVHMLRQVAAHVIAAGLALADALVYLVAVHVVSVVSYNLGVSLRAGLFVSSPRHSYLKAPGFTLQSLTQAYLSKNVLSIYLNKLFTTT